MWTKQGAWTMTEMCLILWNFLAVLCKNYLLCKLNCRLNVMHNHIQHALILFIFVLLSIFKSLTRSRKLASIRYLYIILLYILCNIHELKDKFRARLCNNKNFVYISWKTSFVHILVQLLINTIGSLCVLRLYVRPWRQWLSRTVGIFNMTQSDSYCRHGLKPSK